MRDHAAVEFEGRVSRVIRSGRIFLAALVPALRDVLCAAAGHGFDFAEQIVEHVAPVTDHVEDHAAAVLGTIIPGRPLRR